MLLLKATAMESQIHIETDRDQHLDIFDDISIPEYQFDQETNCDFEGSTSLSLQLENMVSSEIKIIDEDLFDTSASSLLPTMSSSTRDVNTIVFNSDSVRSLNSPKPDSPNTVEGSTNLFQNDSNKLCKTTSLKNYNTTSIKENILTFSQAPGSLIKAPFHVAAPSTPIVEHGAYQSPLFSENDRTDKSNRHQKRFHEKSKALSLISSKWALYSTAVRYQNEVLMKNRNAQSMLFRNSTQQFTPEQEEHSQIAIKQKCSGRRMQRRWYKFAKPSKYCHICARHSRVAKMLPCHNVQENICQKSVCVKCIAQYSLSGESEPWLCPHCKNQCPVRAKCYTYNRHSLRRQQRISKIKCRKY